MSDLRFDGKIIALTNGSSLLGQHLISYFSSLGAKIIALVSSSISLPCTYYKSYKDFLHHLKSLKRLDILISLLPSHPHAPLDSTSWDDISPCLSSIFTTTSAVWRIMKKQKTGKILNIFNTDSFYSNENTALDSIITLAHQGFSNTLTREGAKLNIKVNTVLIAPVDKEKFSTSQIIPVVAYLVHEKTKETGGIFEASGGLVAKIRAQRSGGWYFDSDFTAENVVERMADIKRFNKYSDNPVAFTESLLKVIYIVKTGKPKI